MSKRVNISSGAKWEAIAGYSRAVKIGNVIEVSGTAPPIIENEVVGKGDPFVQTAACIKIIQRALKEAGAGLKDIVRTRMFVTDISMWEEFARAHSEYFQDIRPATSMVEVSRLIHRDMLIEIEVTAILSN